MLSETSCQHFESHEMRIQVTPISVASFKSLTNGCKKRFMGGSNVSYEIPHTSMNDDLRWGLTSQIWAKIGHSVLWELPWREMPSVFHIKMRSYLPLRVDLTLLYLLPSTTSVMLSEGQASLSVRASARPQCSNKYLTWGAMGNWKKYPPGNSADRQCEHRSSKESFLTLHCLQ